MGDEGDVWKILSVCKERGDIHPDRKAREHSS